VVQIHGVVPKAETPERTNENTQKYAEACKSVGAAFDLPVLDLWTLMQQPSDWETALLSDGLHLTPEGNEFLFNNLLQLINESIPQLKYVPAFGCCVPDVISRWDIQLC
jgi:lysophospholipase L1-like esterase